MQKYAIDVLEIEIGRWCNMTCDHCYKGNRERLTIDPKYIEKFLDNIYFVNRLHFCGGESSLYIDTMTEILEIFKKKNVPINYVRVFSNILTKNPRFVSFLNNIGTYSEHPDNVKLFISKDTFHLKNISDIGLPSTHYESNKKWYREKLNDSVILRENDNPEWRLMLEGKAKHIPKDKLQIHLTKEYDYEAFKNCLIITKTITNKDNGNIMDYALDFLLVSAEGYIYTADLFSYDTQRYNNHELSLGQVDCVLEDMIKSWNDKIDTQHEKSVAVIVNDGITSYITKSCEMLDEIRQAVYSRDEVSLIRLKTDAEEMMECFKKDLDYYIDNQEFETKNETLPTALIAIQANIQIIDALLKIPNGFFRMLGMKVIDSQK